LFFYLFLKYIKYVLFVFVSIIFLWLYYFRHSNAIYYFRHNSTYVIAWIIVVLNFFMLLIFLLKNEIWKYKVYFNRKTYNDDSFKLDKKLIKNIISFIYRVYALWLIYGLLAWNAVLILFYILTLAIFLLVWLFNK